MKFWDLLLTSNSPKITTCWDLVTRILVCLLNTPFYTYPSYA